MNYQANMVNFYFNQADQYMSESKDKLIPIAEMHPAHAANAARRLLTDCNTWAKDAGQESNTYNYALWVVKSALFKALTARAAGAAEAKAGLAHYACAGCSFTTMLPARAFLHEMETEHVTRLA